MTSATMTSAAERVERFRQWRERRVELNLPLQDGARIVRENALDALSQGELAEAAVWAQIGSWPDVANAR